MVTTKQLAQKIMSLVFRISCTAAIFVLSLLPLSSIATNSAGPPVSSTNQILLTPQWFPGQPGDPQAGLLADQNPSNLKALSCPVPIGCEPAPPCPEGEFCVPGFESMAPKYHENSPLDCPLAGLPPGMPTPASCQDINGGPFPSELQMILCVRDKLSLISCRYSLPLKGWQSMQVPGSPYALCYLGRENALSRIEGEWQNSCTSGQCGFAKYPIFVPTSNGCGQEYCVCSGSWGQYREISCPPNSGPGPYSRDCRQANPNYSCDQVGHPTEVLTGNKHLAESDYQGSGSSLPLHFRRYYNSMYAHAGDYRKGRTALGAGWSFSYSRRLEVVDASGSLNGAWVIRDDGHSLYFFKRADGSYISPKGFPAELRRVLNDGVVSYELKGESGETEIYDVEGGLQSMTLGGETVRIYYDQVEVPVAWPTPDGPPVTGVYGGKERIARVVSSDGRAIHFSYDTRFISGVAWVNVLSSVTLPDGKILSFGHASGTHLLERVDVIAGGVPAEKDRYTYHAGGQRLLQAVYRGGSEYSRYEYDGTGWRVKESWLSNGAEQVDKFQFQYGPSADLSASQTRVILPLGQQGVYTSVRVGNQILRVASRSSHGTTCTNCSGNAQSFTYDIAADGSGTGFVKTRTDFRGFVTEYVHDPRGLPLQRIEVANGLAGNAACPAGVDCGLTRRSVQTQWHPDFRVPVSRLVRQGDANGTIVERQSWAYNSAGQEVAHCRFLNPAASPTYSCGSSEHAPTGVRQTRRRYCEAGDSDFGTEGCPRIGVLKSTDGPRVDLADTITRLYYAADHASCSSSPSTCPYRKGDLWKLIDALGHVSEFVAYDGAGRVLRQKDANGVITDMGYHDLGWLTTRSVRANADGSQHPQDAVTRLEYAANGDIRRVLQPDDSGLEYCRDAARRITAVVQVTRAQASRCLAGLPVQGSEAIIYTLDAAGNRLREEVRDSSGAIRRLLARQFNTLSQLRALVNAPYASGSNLDDPAVRKTTYAHDLNGNQDLSTDPLGRVSDNDYDPLNRLIRSIQDADTPTSSGEISATVQYNLNP